MVLRFDQMVKDPRLLHAMHFHYNNQDNTPNGEGSTSSHLADPASQPRRFALLPRCTLYIYIYIYINLYVHIYIYIYIYTFIIMHVSREVEAPSRKSEGLECPEVWLVSTSRRHFESSRPPGSRLLLQIELQN